ncbi:NC domain containing protein [Aphelenchoides avenae]|nr:NC domain containing protein [Aphelenchus avenae]
MLFAERISEWCTPAELLEFLVPGDLVEYDCVFMGKIPYRHWAVYIGKVGGVPTIVHYATPSGDFGIEVTPEMATSLLEAGFTAESMGLFNSGKSKKNVRKDSLLRTQGPCRVNNSMDETKAPYSTDVIIDRALQRLGEDEYDLERNNCEHFAKYCRYGVADSEQVRVVRTYAVGAAVAGGAAYFAYQYFYSSKTEESEQKKRDKDRGELLLTPQPSNACSVM